MFYLRSRGLSAEDARAMLTLAFVHDILDEIHDTTFRDLAAKEVEGWLHEQI
jgi:Fe-S cluster assembly scaffold protein SufB